MDEEIPPEVKEMVAKAFEEEFVALFRKALDEALTEIMSAMPRIEGELWAEARRLNLTGREYVVRKPE